MLKNFSYALNSNRMAEFIIGWNFKKMYNKMNGYNSFRNSRWLSVWQYMTVLWSQTWINCVKVKLLFSHFFFTLKRKRKREKKILNRIFFSSLHFFHPYTMQIECFLFCCSTTPQNWINEEVAVASSVTHYHQES